MSRNLFVDRAIIQVAAGKGGNGASHFLREKYRPLGGPDGGDGGRGGNIVFKAESGLKTLVDFSFKQTYEAEPGQPGRGKKMYGRHGEDCIVRVPQGTLVFNKDAQLLADLSDPEQEMIVAKGGRGGRGNVHFATALKRAPKLAEKGEPGEELELILELKLLADVGLVGLPNAGKSTMLAAVSAAHPKIADYPFTTITPNLGRVRIGESASFVMVDIPGLIEGAAEGHGLGHEFLRHIERNRLLIHIVDVGFPEVHPLEDFETLNKELEAYNPKLLERPQLVALNKVDLIADESELNELEEAFKAKGCEVFCISAATKKGVDPLIQRAYHLLKTVPEEPLFKPVARIKADENQPRFIIIPLEDNRWQVKGKEVEKWVAMTDFENEEAVLKLQDIFERMGLTEAFKAHKIEEGDAIVVGKEEFEFKPDV